MMGKKGMGTVVVALAAFAFAGSASAASKDVVDTIAASPNHKTLTQLIKSAGLEQTLRGKGPFTVVAPSDDAFALLPKSLVDSLGKPENKAQLTKVLQYHVLPGNYPQLALTRADTLANYRGVQNIAAPAKADQFCREGCQPVPPVQTLGRNGGNTNIFNNNNKFKTAEGSEITVGQWEGSVDGVWVNHFARVTKANIGASNGVVHAIDRVLLPK
jgi:uncharacterized surface protein with fasciclin (FAS1) repeats